MVGERALRDALFAGAGLGLRLFDGRLAGSALDYAGFHNARLDSLFVTVTGAETNEQLGAAWR